MITKWTFRTIVGDIEDNGLLLGLMKFDRARESLSGEISIGVEKSAISLLNTMHVEGDSIRAPKG